VWSGQPRRRGQVSASQRGRAAPLDQEQRRGWIKRHTSDRISELRRRECAPALKVLENPPLLEQTAKQVAALHRNLDHPRRGWSWAGEGGRPRDRQAGLVSSCHGRESHRPTPSGHATAPPSSCSSDSRRRSPRPVQARWPPGSVARVAPRALSHRERATTEPVSAGILALTRSRASGGCAGGIAGTNVSRVRDCREKREIILVPERSDLVQAVPASQAISARRVRGLQGCEGVASPGLASSCPVAPSTALRLDRNLLRLAGRLV
jgi:hypothetical protein